MPTNRLIVKEEVATYATMLFESLYEAGGQDAILEAREQLEAITSYMRTSIDLSEALADDSYTSQQHHAIVKNTFTALGFNPVLVEVMAVMAERGDITLLRRVGASFEELLQSKLGISVVDVITAVDLDDKLRQLISSKTSAEFGTKVIVRERIDKSILGGIIMSARGQRIDASVKARLESARTVLKLPTDGGERS